jgi:hypothetical protein
MNHLCSLFIEETFECWCAYQLPSECPWCECRLWLAEAAYAFGKTCSWGKGYVVDAAPVSRRHRCTS